MAEIFQGTQVPAWLQDIAKPVDAKETGQIFGSLISAFATSGQRAKEKNKTLPADQQTNWLKEIPSGFRDNLNRLQDPLWDYHVQQAQLGIAQNKLKMDQAQIDLNSQKKDVADQDHDQQIYAEWIGKYNTVQARENAPPPDFRSKKWMDWYDTIKDRDSKSSVQKSIQAAQTQFNKDLAALDPTERATVMRMPPNPDGMPSPQQLEYVKLANQLREQKRANELAAARKAAGKPSKTTITTDTKGTHIKEEYDTSMTGAGGPQVTMVEGVPYIKTKSGWQPVKQQMTAYEVENQILQREKMLASGNIDPDSDDAKDLHDQIQQFQNYLAQKFPGAPGGPKPSNRPKVMKIEPAGQ